MNKTSNVGKCILHSIDAGSLAVTWQVGCTKAVLSALRERQVVSAFLTCAACRRLPGVVDKDI